MTWIDDHRQSEQFASDATLAYRRGDELAARALYVKAAEAEQNALLQLDTTKARTRGVTAVSVVSLWFKAGDYTKAEQLAYSHLSAADIPAFARSELRSLVQAIWTEDAKHQAGVSFLPGQVYVSVRGGEVITGGAPLDLVVDKVQTIQSIFYRTIEEAKSMPLRKRGGPNREIQEACRPWLFQAPPGSYQFSVAIQEPVQKDFFNEDARPAAIAERFLDILRATASGEAEQLNRLVPDQGYRATFLKLARNLAPTGKLFEELQLRTAGTGSPVSLSPESRRQISASLKAEQPQAKPSVEQTEVVLRGTLRALDLDKDFIDVASEGASHHVVGLKDALDDVIGPMVNRLVIVRALRSSNTNMVQFVDIELDE